MLWCIWELERGLLCTVLCNVRVDRVGLMWWGAGGGGGMVCVAPLGRKRGRVWGR